MSNPTRNFDELTARYEKLTERLALVCKENSALTNKVAFLEQEKEILLKTPFNKESALGQLILAAEKGGGATAGKNTAKEQLQKLCASLQKEYVEYKTTHTHSDEEFESLTKQLQSSQNKSAELASMLRDLPLGSASTQGLEKGTRAGMQGKQIEELKAEVVRLQKELRESSTLGSSASSVLPNNELSLAKAEITSLKQELESVRKALVTEEGLHKMKVEESAELAQRLESMRIQHKEELSAFKEKNVMDRNEQSGRLEGSRRCENCTELDNEIAILRGRFTDAQDELTRTRSQISQSVSAIEKKCASVEAKLIETQAELSEKDLQLSHSVSQASYDLVSAERQKLLHEVSLMKERVNYLEKVVSRSPTDGNKDESNTLDDEEILAALERYKERICTLEFEKEQLMNSIRALEKNVIEGESKREEEKQKAEADSQRVAYLLKKSTNLASDLRELQTEKGNLSDTLLVVQAELQRAQRQVDTIPALQKKLEDYSEANRQLEERLSAAKEMEERLVKAKETIAYMELSQSRCISLAQYAELQAEKVKLEHSVAPIQIQLDEAKKEVDGLKEELQKCAKEQTEKDQLTVENLQDEVDGLKENEKILMEKLAHYKEENQRLASLNVTLDSQMESMQHGIKEMATHMEKVRTEAKEVAEKAAEREVLRLREELEHARSTIAGVQATEGQYVPEGLYLSAVEEKQDLFNEVQRKKLELEKMKSELSIYRETIKELEAEITEYVSDIEELQRKLDAEKVSVEQRKVEHEKQLVNMQEELLDLQELVEKQNSHLQDNNVLIGDLKQKSAKQQVMYEEVSLELKKVLLEIAKRNAAAEENSPSLTTEVLRGVDGENDAVARGETTTAPSSSGANGNMQQSSTPRKKVKKVKKKKTLAEQLNEDAEEDILQVAEAQITASAGTLAAASPDARALDSSSFPSTTEMEKGLASRSAEIERLQNENLNLKKSIERLNAEVDELRERVAEAAQNGVSVSNASSDLGQLRKDLQEAQALAEKMKTQRDQAKMECKRAKALNVGGSAEREQELESELEEVRAELEVVASQLLPIKEKLSEYMAMADRIGIPYPFCEDYERRLARKMRSLKKYSEKNAGSVALVSF